MVTGVQTCALPIWGGDLENKTIKVVIDKKEASSSDANSIIKTVMEKTKNEYQVEVKFISET